MAGRKTSNRQIKGIGRLKRILAAAVFLLYLTTATAVFGAGRIPDLEAGRRGTLEAVLLYTDTKEETSSLKPMPQVQVKLAKIASLEVKDSRAEYTLLAPYKDSGVVLTDMTASQSHEEAERLAALAAGSEIQTATANQKGIVTFSELEPGMYLVFQDSNANAAYHMKQISAFLVSIPYLSKSEDIAGWQYTVKAYPKTEHPLEEPSKKPTEKPTEGPTEKPTEGPTEEPSEKPDRNDQAVSSVKTGDETPVMLFMAWMLVSAVVIFIGILYGRHGRNH